MDKIAIIGTGLIGASLGLAIKRAGIKDVHIVGSDINRGHASKAQKMGAVDQVEGSLVSAAKDAEIVIIATPVMAIKDAMEIIAPHLKEGCLVTDTGSSKGTVMEWAEQYLPRNVNFIGGNPIVGKEGGGPDAAVNSLFQDRPYCIIPAKRASQDSVKLMTDMLRSIGSKPFYMDAGEHDSFVSAVSHLPFLLSVALVSCASKSPSWDDIAKVASEPYKNLTSLASGDPATYRDIFLGKDQSIVYWIDTFISELYEIRKIIVSDKDGKREALEKTFSQAFVARTKWLAGLVTSASQAAANRERIPSATEGFMEMFTGDAEARRRLFGWGSRRDRDSKDKR